MGDNYDGRSGNGVGAARRGKNRDAGKIGTLTIYFPFPKKNKK
jgi:hypothetical protein